MGMVRLPDELQQVIDQQVALGKAASPQAFLEEAVARLISDAQAEEAEIAEAVKAGAADMAAGRYVTIATPEDGQRLHDDLVATFRASLARHG